MTPVRGRAKWARDGSAVALGTSHGQPGFWLRCLAANAASGSTPEQYVGQPRQDVPEGHHAEVDPHAALADP